MHQPVLLTPNIHKSAKIGNIGYYPGEYHSLLEVVYILNAGIKFKYFNYIPWIASVF